MLLPGIGDATARAADDVDAGARVGSATRSTHLIAPPRAREAHRSLAALLRQLRGATRRDGEDAAPVRATSRPSARSTTRCCARSTTAPSRAWPTSTSCRRSPPAIPIAHAFLAALALEPPSSTQDLAGGSESDEATALVLSTVHSAKGKEWDAVFLIWAVDGWFPSSRAVGRPGRAGGGAPADVRRDDARADQLAVVYPLNVYASRRGADYSIDQLSRFLDRGVRATMQRVSSRSLATFPLRRPLTAPAIDLRAIMRGRFGK